jgi:transposase InsO family protein
MAFDTFEPAANLKPHGVRNRVAHKCFNLFALHIQPPCAANHRFNGQQLYTRSTPGKGSCCVRRRRAKRFGPILALRSLWNPKGTRCSTPISSSSPMARSPRSFDRLGHRLARSWRCFDAASAVGLSELIDRRRFKTQAEARLAVFEWIEGWYNPHRRHSWLGRISPVNFERRQLQSKAA